MRIEKASEKDAELISRMISSEFPYTEANPENLKKRMQRQNIRLFKAVEEGKIVGFIELEFLDNLFGVWRINGIAVEEKHRKKGFGKKLAAIFNLLLLDIDGVDEGPGEQSCHVVRILAKTAPRIKDVTWPCLCIVQDPPQRALDMPFAKEHDTENLVEDLP